MDYKYIVGVDPGSNKNGVAIYEEGKLIKLDMLQEPELINLWAKRECLFSVEHVDDNKFIYSRNVQENLKSQGRVGQNVGMNRQSQVNLCRWLDWLNVDYVLHKPQKGNWSHNKPLFERVTGWEGRSNEHNRSAAYFGYLSIKK